MILNEIERAVICGKQEYRTNADFIDAIEAAVIAKLAQGVSVEPVAWIGLRNGIEHMTSQWKIAEADSATYDTPLYTTTAIAAARVQALEEAAVVCEKYATDKWSLYKGRPPYNGTEQGRADPDTQGHSDGANACADAIRALKGGAA